MKRQGAVILALASLSISSATYAGCAKSDTQTPATNTQTTDQNQPMSSASTTTETSQPQTNPVAQPAMPAPMSMETEEIKPG